MRRDALVSLGIALAFCAAAFGILALREEVVPYRLGQRVGHDIGSRVDFAYTSPEDLLLLRQEARNAEPRVYRSKGDTWGGLEKRLLKLPELAVEIPAGQVPADLDGFRLDEASLAYLRQARTGDHRAAYTKTVAEFIAHLQGLVILSAEDREADVRAPLRRGISAQMADGHYELRALADTYSYTGPNDPTVVKAITEAAKGLPAGTVRTQLAAMAVTVAAPTHELDQAQTVSAQDRASEGTDPTSAARRFVKGQVIVSRGTEIDRTHLQWLHEEQRRFIENLRENHPRTLLESRLGMVGMVILLTLAFSAYVAHYQPRVIRNHARAMAIVGLMLSMLLLAQLAAMGTGPLYFFGVAPTILVAMIMVIAYDRRFAVGVGTMHAIMVTCALDQNLSFFLILWMGVMTCCFLLREVRTRGRLIEVGGATAIVMAATAAAVGAVGWEPARFIQETCLYVGAAGLGVGFVVLGILPFIEKAFRITTSMTLLELADASQPLLRRLAMEAPGTYNHSLQVATLAESVGESVGANPLLCRVGSYYHDIGKINKAEYFCENQTDGTNRHINLSPNVSLLIIIGHVKDGVEMAREYNLPTILFPFIQQHHGTTLVEYFYYQACHQKDPSSGEQPAISEMQYRYAGPKPRTKETAIVMIADAAESATRAMVDPNPSRLETLVHDLVMKRLLDGQFDECNLTFRELELAERTLTKALLGIYHSRMTYPSTAATTQAPAAIPAARTA